MDKRSNFDLLFEISIRHLYSAETEVFEALLEMAESAQSRELKEALFHHREETGKQIDRLKRVFALFNIDIQSSKLQGIRSLSEQGKHLLKTFLDLNFTDRSKGMNGILSEAKELMRHFKETEANDFALASAGGKVENFEIGCYTFLCSLVEKMEEEEALKLLETSLEEEKAMEEKIRLFTKEGVGLVSKQ